MIYHTGCRLVDTLAGEGDPARASCAVGYPSLDDGRSNRRLLDLEIREVNENYD